MRLARLYKSRVVLREERTKSRRTVPSGVGGIKSVTGAFGASHPIKPLSVERAPAGGVRAARAAKVFQIVVMVRGNMSPDVIFLAVAVNNFICRHPARVARLGPYDFGLRFPSTGRARTKGMTNDSCLGVRLKRFGIASAWARVVPICRLGTRSSAVVTALVAVIMTPIMALITAGGAVVTVGGGAGGGATVVVMTMVGGAGRGGVMVTLT